MAPYPRDLEEAPSPWLPQPASETPPSGDTGGGFFSGVMDLLRNVPLTFTARNRPAITLPSYNQMTSGKRLVDYGQAQGLDMGGLQGKSVSPGEAEFAVQQGLAKRKEAPLGLDFAQSILPPQEGEGQEVGLTRQLIARMRQQDLPALLQHVTESYGVLPGLNIPTVDPYAALGGLPSEAHAPITQTPSALPQPPGHGGPVTPPTSAVAPAVPVQNQLATPTVAPLAPVGTSPAGMVFGAPPAEPSREITREEILAHPMVTPFVAEYQRVKSPKNAAALRGALAGAPAKIRAERHQQYMDRAKNYQENIKAVTTAKDLNIPRWTNVPALDAKLAEQNPGLGPLDIPTSEQRARARQGVYDDEVAQKTRLEREGLLTKEDTEQAIRSGQTVFDVVGRDPDKLAQWRDRETAQSLPPDTPYAVAKQNATTLSTQQAKRLDDQLDAMPIVQRLNYYVQEIYGPRGVYENMSGDERRALSQGSARTLQNLQQRYPIIAEAQAYINANGEKLARALGGLSGAGTEGDVARSKALFPELSSALGVRWEGWKPNVSWDMPDTRGVALRKINALNVTLDKITGHILKNPQFQHEGLLPRLPEPEVSQDRKFMGTSGKIPAVPSIPTSQSGLPNRKALEAQVAATPGMPGAKPKAMPNDQRAMQSVYREMGIQAPPNAAKEPQKFEQFLTAFRLQVGRMRPGTPPGQLDAAVGNLGRALAKQQGVVWPATP
jgi:hypothetical protein